MQSRWHRARSARDAHVAAAQRRGSGAKQRRSSHPNRQHNQQDPLSADRNAWVTVFPPALPTPAQRSNKRKRATTGAAAPPQPAQEPTSSAAHQPSTAAAARPLIWDADFASLDHDADGSVSTLLRDMAWPSSTQQRQGNAPPAPERRWRPLPAAQDGEATRRGASEPLPPPMNTAKPPPAPRPKAPPAAPRSKPSGSESASPPSVAQARISRAPGSAKDRSPRSTVAQQQPSAAQMPPHTPAGAPSSSAQPARRHRGRGRLMPPPPPQQQQQQQQQQRALDVERSGWYLLRIQRPGRGVVGGPAAQRAHAQSPNRALAQARWLAALAGPDVDVRGSQRRERVAPLPAHRWARSRCSETLICSCGVALAVKRGVSVRHVPCVRAPRAGSPPCTARPPWPGGGGVPGCDRRAPRCPRPPSPHTQRTAARRLPRAPLRTLRQAGGEEEQEEAQEGQEDGRGTKSGTCCSQPSTWTTTTSTWKP